MVIVKHVRKCLAVVLICMSLLFSVVDIFSCDSFKGCELTLYLEIGHPMPALFWILFSDT